MYPAIGRYNHVWAPAAGGACTGSVCRPAKPSSRLLSGFAQEAGTSAGVLPNRRDRIIVAIPPRMIGPR